MSTNGGTTFNAITGATSTTYSFTTTSAENGNQYEAVFTNSLGSFTSSPATLTVDYAPTVTTNPASQTVNAGSTATFTAAASGNPAPTVQWEVSTNGGTTFTPITRRDLDHLQLHGHQRGKRRRVRGGLHQQRQYGDHHGGDVDGADYVDRDHEPASQTVNAGSTATFTAAASGNPAPTVQWEVSTNGGTTFTPITGATSTTYSFTAASAENGNQYEAVFTNSAGTLTSSPATLTVDFAPTVTTNPTSQTVNAGSTATFTAAASGNPAPTVQWEVSTNGGTTFSPITGATSTTYSFTASSAENGNEYEAVFTNSVSSATTTAATLTVDYVTTQPASQTVNAGSTATFTAAASGNPAPSVQWEVSTDGGDDVHRHHRSDLDHLQLHGQQRGKRQPVRGRLHQRRRHAHEQPRHADGGVRRRS